MLAEIQVLTLLFLTLLLITHDLIPLGKWNNVGRLNRDPSTDVAGILTNAAVGIIPLYLAWKDRGVLGFTSSRRAFVIILIAVLMGAAYSWWIPWLFGTSNKRERQLREISKGTLTFVPDRHSVNPNALHCVIHALTLLALLETLALGG